MPRPRSAKAAPPAAPPAVLPAEARARTLADVAKALGVSRTTVSNAFNQPGQLSEALRTRILSGSRELGYFGPNTMARALRRREMREVAVVFHHDLRYAMNDPPSLEFLRGVAAELDKRRLNLQLIPKLGRNVELAAAFQTTADALIVHAEIGGDVVAEVAGVNKPIVLVDAWVDGTPTISVEDRRGATMAMEHALAARPDRIVVLSFPLNEADRRRALLRGRPPRSNFVAGERLAGYAAALRAAGFSMERIVWAEVDDRYPESAAEHIAQLRGQWPENTRLALVSMSDRMALAALGVLRGWGQMETVAAVGFDDIPAAAEAGLTTVRQDIRLKGELAVRVVLDGLESSTLPVELVVRAT